MRWAWRMCRCRRRAKSCRKRCRGGGERRTRLRTTPYGLGDLLLQRELVEPWLHRSRLADRTVPGRKPLDPPAEVKHLRWIHHAESPSVGVAEMKKLVADLVDQKKSSEPGAVPFGIGLVAPQGPRHAVLADDGIGAHDRSRPVSGERVERGDAIGDAAADRGVHGGADILRARDQLIRDDDVVRKRKPADEGPENHFVVG